jgi:hypothetical protein
MNARSMPKSAQDPGDFALEAQKNMCARPGVRFPDWAIPSTLPNVRKIFSPPGLGSFAGSRAAQVVPRQE